MPRVDLIQLRGGTYTEWETANPVLAAKEPGLVTDFKTVVYGDGAKDFVTLWSERDVTGGGGTSRFFESEADLIAALDPESPSRQNGEWALVQGETIITIWTWSSVTGVWSDTAIEINFTVDQAFDPLSTNAIANKIVFAALGNKLDSDGTISLSQVTGLIDALSLKLEAGDIYGIVSPLLEQGFGISIQKTGTKFKFINTNPETGTAANWGSVGGALSDQSDLIAALNAKFGVVEYEEMPYAANITLNGGVEPGAKFRISEVTGGFEIDDILSDHAGAAEFSCIAELSGISSAVITVPSYVTEGGASLPGNQFTISGEIGEHISFAFEKRGSNWELFKKVEPGGSGTTDYEDLDNKPAINGVELSGNKSLTDLGITAAISAAVDALLDGAPGALDTLNELAAALNDDASFAATVATTLAGKQATLVSGTNIKTLSGLSLLGSGDIAPTLGRTASLSILCDNIFGVFYLPYTQTADVSFSLAGSGHKEGSVAKLLFSSDGVHTIEADLDDFDFVYGIELDGSTVLPEGVYEIFVMYNGSGKASFCVPGGNSTSGGSTVVDVTPPTFQASTPYSSSVTQSSFDLNVQLNEPGIVYYVVVANGATAPSESQIKAGLNGSGLSAIQSGSINVVAGAVLYNETVSGLTSTTDYDVYSVAEDTAGNTQLSVTKIDVTTSSSSDVTPPTFVSSYPTVTANGTGGFTLQVQLTEIGVAYYVVVGNGESAPNAAQVKAGNNSAGAAALKSGTINVLAATTTYSDVIAGLSPGTTYKVYVIAEDAVPNLQASPTLISTSTTNLILLTDDFAGTTINTSKHTVTDPADAVTISQNNSLIFAAASTGTTSNLAVNTVVGASTWNNSELAFAWKVQRSGTLSASFILGVTVDANNYVRITRSSTTPFSNVRIIVVSGGSTVYDFEGSVALSASGGRWWKVFKNSANQWSFYYFNGTNWVQVDAGNMPTANLGTVFNHYMWAGSSAGITATNTIYAMRIVANNYTTETP